MNQGGNYWTLFTPGIWKVLHAFLHLDQDIDEKDSADVGNLRVALNALVRVFRL